MTRRSLLLGLLVALFFTSLAASLGCGGDDDVGAVPDGGAGGDGGPTMVDAGGETDAGMLVWESLEPPADGPLRVWGFMTAHLDDARTVLIGGATFDASSGGTAVDETWLYEATADGLSVTEVVTPDNTGPRYCGCAGWDPVRERVVVVGGRDDRGAEYPPETWELDLATPAWTRIDVPETPESVVGCGLAFAEDRGALHLFGGGSTRGFSDRIYRYDPSVPAWVALDATGPGARYDMAFTSLGAGKPILMYGGSLGADGVAFFSDVWLFDPMTETWTESVPTNGEGLARRTPWLVRDADGAGFLVGFGNTGLDPEDARADVAHYDLASGVWSDVTPTLDPSGGPGPHGFTQPLGAGAYGVGVLFGGYDNVRPVGEVWRLARR